MPGTSGSQARLAQRLGPGKLRRIPPAYIPINTGVLQGTASLTFAASASLSQPRAARLTIGPGKIRRIPFAYTTTSNLAGNAALNFAASASPATLQGSAALTFGLSGTLFVAVNLGRISKPGPGAGPFSNLQFLPAPRATTPLGALTGTSALTFAASASFVQGGALAGTSALTFAAGAFPRGAGALAGAAALTFTVNGALIAGGISGNASLSFSASAVGLPLGLVPDLLYVIRRAQIRSFAARLPERSFDITRSFLRAFEVSRMSLTFDTKAPSESVPLTFDFTPDLPAGVTLTGQPIVQYGVSVGADTNPGKLANGSAGFDNTSMKVIVPVTGGINGVEYRITVTCPTTQSNLVLTLSAILPVTLN